MKRFMNEENKGNKLPLFIMQMVFLSFTLVILVCLLPFFLLNGRLFTKQFKSHYKPHSNIDASKEMTMVHRLIKPCISMNTYIHIHSQLKENNRREITSFTVYFCKVTSVCESFFSRVNV